MGLFKKINASVSTDQYQEHFGEVNLREDKDALCEFWDAYERGNYNYADKALCLFKSFIPLTTEEYNSLRNKFRENETFWYDWIKALDFNDLYEEAKNPGSFPIFYFIKDMLFVGSGLDRLSLACLYNNTLKLAASGINDVEYYRNCAFDGNEIGAYANEDMDWEELFSIDYELYNKGVSKEERRNCFFKDPDASYKIRPISMIKDKVDEMGFHEPRPMSLDDFKD